MRNRDKGNHLVIVVVVVVVVDGARMRDPLFLEQHIAIIDKSPYPTLQALLLVEQVEEHMAHKIRLHARQFQHHPLRLVERTFSKAFGIRILERCRTW